METLSKVLNKNILVILFALLFVNRCYCQGNNSNIDSTSFKKNVINVSLGVDPSEFYGTLMGNYERMIVHFPKSFVNSLWVRVGAGPWVWWSGKGTNFVSTISILTGRKGAHIETGVGILFTYDSRINDFHPLVHNRYFQPEICPDYDLNIGVVILKSLKTKAGA